MELFFDTETSGFINKTLAREDPNQSWIMQLAMILSTEKVVLGSFHAYIYDDDRKVSKGALKVHGITPEMTVNGLNETGVASVYIDFLNKADIQIAHNFDFDIQFMECLMHRLGYMNMLAEVPHLCTMKSTTDILKLSKPNGPGYKWPKLEELYHYLFNEDITGAHNAIADVRATRKCYYELKKRGLI